MRRTKLMASPGELGLLGALAASRGRIRAAAAISVVATLGYGLVAERFVMEQSGDVVVNLFVLCGQVFLMLAAAYVVAMWAACERFGDAWRRRVFLGERIDASADEDEAAPAMRDNTAQFYLFLAAAAVALYAAIAATTGGYIDRYNQEGYVLARLRAGDPAERVAAIRALVDPVRRDSSERVAVRDRLAATVDDASDDVAAWAAWASGVLGVQEAVPGLVRALARPSTELRIEAVIALGRLHDPLAERQMVELLQTAAPGDPLVEPLCVALGVIGSPQALEALLTVARGSDDAAAEVALWAIGQARSTSPRAEVVAIWEAATGGRRCAAAEALKHVSTVEDDATLREAFRALDQGVECEPRSYVGRSYDEEHTVATIQTIVGEPLRMKYLKAVFNIAGSGLEPWLVDIAWSPDEPDSIKVQADQLAQAIHAAPSRPPRE
ncbi:MAG: HEAT repeat domain-containing protein [Myxococcales bacterium]|nr:HEAT repeat domain-containing protein [Myxococcales bacterium]